MKKTFKILLAIAIVIFSVSALGSPFDPDGDGVDEIALSVCVPACQVTKEVHQLKKREEDKADDTLPSQPSVDAVPLYVVLSFTPASEVPADSLIPRAPPV